MNTVSPGTNVRNRMSRVAMEVLFPLMVTTMVLLQQQKHPVLLSIGLATSILTTVAALTICLGELGFRWVPVSLAVGTVGLRLARFVSHGEMLVNFYTVFAGALFCLAGAIVALHASRLVYRQLMILWLIAMPLMTLQLVGVGNWTQVLRTDLNGDYRDTRPSPTFLRKPHSVELSATQIRPAGPLPSNNMLSFLLVFGVALHFARANRAWPSWHDGVLIAVSVLSMSKLVYLAIAVMAGWVFVVGGGARRRRVLGIVALLAIMTTMYAVLFPAAFDYNASWSSIKMNFAIRLADLRFASAPASPAAADLPSATVDALTKPIATPDPLTRPTATPEPLTRPTALSVLAERLGVAPDVAVAVQQGRQSGYAAVVRFLPLVTLLVVILAPAYLRGLGFLRRRAPDWLMPTTLCLVAVTMVPFITSFIEGVMFWFMAGFALLPMGLVAESRLETVTEFAQPDLESPSMPAAR